jgi:Domain of unknown function (DUF6398)
VRAAVIDIDELKVPRALRQVVDEILRITDSVCLTVLDEEYADLARRAVAALARKRPSPLSGGRRTTWAAGVVYALAQVNFLFDPSSEPCVSADQLGEAFGVAKSTMGSKARQVRDLLRIGHFSPEFQRADVAEQNPLRWFIEVNGLVVDARDLPLEIQVDAFQRGLIPYVPALGPDGMSVRGGALARGTTAAAAPLEAATLLEHCSELKRRLVEFACSRRFSRELDQAVNEGIGGTVTSESEFTNLLDHFILQRPLADGRTVNEVFVAEHPELTDADRQMLLGWRDVVEGVFEVREQADDAIIAANLIDELAYTIRANSGPRGLAPMRPGSFMTARIVPAGGDWMLSGAQQLYAASDRAAMLRLAAELATQHPRLVFRNPEKVTQGWELARKQRALFIEHFGSDLVVVPGREVAPRMNAFLAWHNRRALAEISSAAENLDADVAALTPAFDVPRDLASTATVALICDETEGLVFLANFSLVQEAFENPGLAADREHREAVLRYLNARSISALPFRRLAGTDSVRASQLFERLLDRPGFSWERDGEALLREHKPWCFETTPQPCITPLRSELAEALQSAR